jgi:hypothetical protein
MIPQRSAVNFVISVHSRMLRPVELVGEGQVIRVGVNSSQAEFAIAIECRKPIAQIEAYLPAGSS